MKKTRILPCFILLIACLAVLCVGIYAASPVSYSVVGSVQINAANANVRITAYIDDLDGDYSNDVQASNIYTSRTPTKIDLYEDVLDFNCLQSYEVSDVDVKPLYFKVENLSSYALGVYFLKGTITGETSIENIALTKDFNGTMGTQTISNLLTVAFTGYTNVPTDGVAYMYAELRLNKLNPEESQVSLNFDINVEKFNGALYSGDKTVGYMNDYNDVMLSATLASGDYTLMYESDQGVLQDYANLCTISSGKGYYGLIEENIAPKDCTKIGVYNSNSERVGHIPLSNNYKNDLSTSEYSFGAISDVHLPTDGAQAKFEHILTYFNNTVDFVNICGDLTNTGATEQLELYKTVVDEYSTVPVNAIVGNHENSSGFATYHKFEEYLGKPLYYTFTQGNDVFIMFSPRGGSEGQLFSVEQLQWLYETLEENRNKRCFVFQHVFPDNSSGNANNIYQYDCWGGNDKLIFESLMNHYKNVLLFHGHSHLPFNLQEEVDSANYYGEDGYHSIHIPSATSPRNYYPNNEGYVLEVHENSVLLKGVDFAVDKFVPIAQYCLDTTIKTIEEKTYIDPTGTLNTTGESVGYVNLLPISTDVDGSIYNGIGYKANTRWSSSSNAEAEYTGLYLSGYIPVNGYGDVVYLKDIKMLQSASNTMVVWFSDYNTVVGTSSVDLLNSNASPVWDDAGNLIQFTISYDAKYIRLQGQGFTERSIVSVNWPIIEEEKDVENALAISTDADGSIYNGVGYKANTRWSVSGNGEVEYVGVYLSGYIKINGFGDVIYLKNVTMSQSAGNTIVVFFSDYNTVVGTSSVDLLNSTADAMWDDSGNLIKFTVPHNAKYIRLQGQGFSSASYVSINKEIKDTSSYINELPIATDIDGSIYNGVGYKANTRWSGSSNAEAEYSGLYLSGYIPVNGIGDIVYLKNLTMQQSNTNTYIIFFTEYGEMAGRWEANLLTNNAFAVWDSDGNLIQFTINLACRYIRIQGQLIDETSIVSVNTPISD